MGPTLGKSSFEGQSVLLAVDKNMQNRFRSVFNLLKVITYIFVAIWNDFNYSISIIPGWFYDFERILPPEGLQDTISWSKVQMAQP